MRPRAMRRIEWADRQMPVLPRSASASRPSSRSDGYRVSACLHVTTETANLMRTLKAGGADVVLCASNPLSTQDDVAAALVDEYGIPCSPIKGEDNDTYYQHIEAAVDHRPARDDGRRRRRGRRAPPARRELLGDVIAGTEETTTGVIRLRALERGRASSASRRRRQRGAHEAPLRQPLRHRAVDDRRHHARDERAARRASTFVVAGYGWCGRGVAMRAKRHGRPRHRDRGRPDAGARGGHGRLPGDADGGGRAGSATSSSPPPATST